VAIDRGHDLRHDDPARVTPSKEHEFVSERGAVDENAAVAVPYALEHG
jgi:hypothetical protein